MGSAWDGQIDRASGKPTRSISMWIEHIVKYFFLTEGWTVGRVWEVGGLWNALAWRREPQIQRMNLAIVEKDEKMWLYQVEDVVLMIEVKPLPELVSRESPIGQVLIKRLMNSDQVIERLCILQATCELGQGELK